MNVLEDLTALAAQAATDEVKKFLADKIESVKAEAQAAVAQVEEHAASDVHNFSDEVKAFLAKAVAALRKVL